QRYCLVQHPAVAPRAVGLRELINAIENISRDLVLIRSKERKLAGIGWVMKIRQIRSRIISLGAAVEIEEEIGVGPLEIEDLGQGAAHPDVLKDLPPGIEGKAGCGGRRLLGQRFEDDLA